MLWLIFALLTAILFALQHILGKKYVKGVDSDYLVYLKILFTVILSIPFVIILWNKFVFNWPTIISFLILGVLIGTAQFFYQKSLKCGAIGKTVPLLSLTPLLTLIIAMFLVSEFPSLVGYLGIVLLVIGSYVINLEKFEKNNILAPFKSIITNRGSLFMLAVAIIYGVSSVLDKYAIINSNVWTRIFILGYFVLAFQTIFLLIRDHGKFKNKAKETLKKKFWPLMILVVILFFTSITHLIAISLTFTAYVVAVKRVSVLFAIVVAFFVFKEKENFTKVLIGTVLMLVGVVLLLF